MKSNSQNGLSEKQFRYYCNTSATIKLSSRAVGRSENLGVPVLFGGHNLPPLVEIGLTDRPKFGGAMAPPAPPGTTGLSCGLPISNLLLFVKIFYLNVCENSIIF